MAQFITYKNNDPINLDLVTKIGKKYDTWIEFFFGENYISKKFEGRSFEQNNSESWYFDSEEERSKVYDRIIKLYTRDLSMSLMDDINIKTKEGNKELT